MFYNSAQSKAGSKGSSTKKDSATAAELAQQRQRQAALESARAAEVARIAEESFNDALKKARRGGGNKSYKPSGSTPQDISRGLVQGATANLFYQIGAQVEDPEVEKRRQELEEAREVCSRLLLTAIYFQHFILGCASI